MFNKITINTLRSFIPDIIAQQIIGVQPMTGYDYKSIFTMRADFTEKSFKMENNYYKTFLRLNNRKKTQTRSDFRKAKYPEVRVQNIDIVTWLDWMKENIGEYNYFYTEETVCFFTSEDLKTLYLLRWS